MGQKHVFRKAYEGVTDFLGFMEAVRKLSKEDASKIVNIIHGITWEKARYNMEYKQKLREGMEEMEKRGYIPECTLCQQPKVKCCC